jgi:hypothetical protein
MIGHGAEMSSTEIKLRVIVVRSPPDVTWWVGSKRGGFPGRERSDGSDLAFELVARIKDGRLLGDGFDCRIRRPGTCWTRRWLQRRPFTTTRLEDSR